MIYLYFSLLICPVTCSFISPLINSLAKSHFIQENIAFYDVIICYGAFENIKIAKGLAEEGKFVKMNSDCNQDIVNFIPKFKEAIVFILDLNCPCAGKLLKHAKQQKLFNTPFRWILVNITEKHNRNNNISFQQNESEDLSPWVQDYGFHVDSRCLYVSSDYRVLELYKLGENETMQADFRAFWENDIIKWIPDDKYKLKMNLQRVLIRTAAVISNNDTFKRLDGNYLINKHIDLHIKLNYIISQLLFETLNASYSMRYLKSWGIKKPNGEWTGLTGYIQRNEIDIGATGLFMIADRLNFTDYLGLTTHAMSFLHFRLPPLSYMNNIFALPFSGIVWICCIGLLVGSGFLWRLTLYFDQPLFEGDRITWSDIYLGIIGAVCQQGTERESRNISGRIIYLMIFIAIMFFFTSYTASIVALLQSKSDSIITLKDIYESGIGIGAENISYNILYLPKQNDTYSKLIWDNKLNPKKFKGGFMSAEEGIRKMRNEFFAFQIEANIAYKIIQETFEENEKCGLSEVIYLKEKDPYMGAPRGNHYADHFRILFRKLKQSGIQQGIYNRLHTSKPQCSGTVNSYVSVGIIDFYPALMILVIGIGFALFIFLLEIIIFKNLKKLNHFLF